MASESLPDYGTLFPSSVTGSSLPTIYYIPPDELSGAAIGTTPTSAVGSNLLPSQSLATTVNPSLAAGTTASQGSSGVGGYQIVGWSSIAGASAIPTTVIVESKSSGLSSGAKTGIIVGCVLGGLLLLGAALGLFILSQRKMRRDKTQRRMGQWRRTSWEIQQKKEKDEQARVEAAATGGNAPPAPALESGYHV